MTDPAAIRATLTALARAQLDPALLADGPPSFDALDSIQRLALVVAIEDHYQIALSPEDDEGVRTFDDLVALIARHLGEKADG